MDQPPDRYQERVLERRAWYDSLSPELQVAYASAWSRHRDQFGLPRARDVVAAHLERTVLPAGATDRDTDYLHRESTGRARRGGDHQPSLLNVDAS